MEQGKQMRFSEEELSVLQGAFKGNEKLVKLLRKVFLPEYDAHAPFGQGIDLWMTIDLRTLNPEQAYLRLLARNELIMHVETQLMQINVLANLEKGSKEDEEKRKKANSTK